MQHLVSSRFSPRFALEPIKDSIMWTRRKLFSVVEIHLSPWMGCLTWHLSLPFNVVWGDKGHFKSRFAFKKANKINRGSTLKHNHCSTDANTETVREIVSITCLEWLAIPHFMHQFCERNLERNQVTLFLETREDKYSLSPAGQCGEPRPLWSLHFFLHTKGLRVKEQNQIYAKLKCDNYWKGFSEGPFKYHAFIVPRYILLFGAPKWYGLIFWRLTALSSSGFSSFSQTVTF